MEEKRVFAPSNTADSPASEPATSRRRGATQKRKANALNFSNSSSAPSKRITRDKASSPHTPPFHNGPLTRARQIPTATVSGDPPASAPAAATKRSERAPDYAALAEQLRKQSEWEALEAAIEAQFEAVRSRDSNAHVVPTHCGWFSWRNIHPIEKITLPSFFNGKTENRTPDTYVEIRNYIIKRFHKNPNVQIELKDLSEINLGDVDARQEIMEFLDYWGLINFHPLPSMASAVARTDDGTAEKNSLLEKLYHFERQEFPPIVHKTSLRTPTMTSSLFPESTVAEELMKQEEPAVEYHCNSCSADCSRKRYHCQKQADFDLCTNCFSNGKFGSGMSSLDFILMEPAKVPVVSGGKWTDQETLLLLEALELYKENWNEIAEHVATKSKAQCILHFIQMPIEDAFVDRGDDANNDSSVHKDALEFDENKLSDGIEDHVPSLQNETAKADDVNNVKVNRETPKPGNVDDEKTCEQASKSEDDVKLKFGQEEGKNYALYALDEAFTSVGYCRGHRGPSSFAEVGNPIMALAVFLGRMVDSDVAVASAHSSLKSMSLNSPGTVLSVRHCFLLEDPPDYKEPTRSESICMDHKDSVREGNLDKCMLNGNALSNDRDDNKHKDNVLEVNRQLASQDDGILANSEVLKEQAMIDNKEVEHDNCNDPGNLKLPSDQATGAVHDSDGSTLKDKVPPSSELREGTSPNESSQPIEELKNGHVLNAFPAENKLEQTIKSNLAETHLQPIKTAKDVNVVSDLMPSDKSNPKTLTSTNPVVGSLDSTNSAMDVDLVSNSLSSEKNRCQPEVTLISSQHTVTEKDVDMMSSSMHLDKNELPHTVKSNSWAENGYSSVAGSDHTENGTKVKGDGKKAKHDNNFKKLKQVAVSTLAAAAVKAKILADEEEDQIRQLASLLIEKQLRKLETKLAFFHDMENVVMKVREYLVQSRQKLYNERALIIASRLGVTASSSRGVPLNLPINRIPMNFANSVPRPQITMNPQRPPISGPVGTIATTLPRHLASAASVGNSVRPSSQESFSSVGIK